MADGDSRGVWTRLDRFHGAELGLVLVAVVGSVLTGVLAWVGLPGARVVGVLALVATLLLGPVLFVHAVVDLVHVLGRGTAATDLNDVFWGLAILGLAVVLAAVSAVALEMSTGSVVVAGYWLVKYGLGELAHPPIGGNTVLAVLSLLWLGGLGWFHHRFVDLGALDVRSAGELSPATGLAVAHWRSLELLMMGVSSLVFLFVALLAVGSNPPETEQAGMLGVMVLFGLLLFAFTLPFVFALVLLRVYLTISRRPNGSE